MPDNPTVRSLDDRLRGLEHKFQVLAEEPDQRLNQFQSLLETFHSVDSRVHVLETHVPSRIDELKSDIRREMETIEEVDGRVRVLESDVSSKIGELKAEIKNE